MRLYNTYYKIINLIITFVIISVITIGVRNYFKPFFIVLIMVILTHPIFKIIIKSKLPKYICAILTILLINISLFVIIYYFGNRLVEIFYKFYKNNTIEFNNLANSIKIFLNLDVDKSIQNIIKYVNGNMIMQGAIITSESVISYLLANIINYFILVDKNKFYRLFSCLFSEKFLESFFRKIENLKDVLKIEAKLIFLSASIITVGFKMLKINNSLFLGILCSILDILPFVGTTIVFIPIIIYNIIIKRYILVVGLVLLYILERFTREILEAKFLSSKLEIHPLAVILSIYIGVNMFGFIGVITGPIYSIIAKDIIYN